MLLIDSENPLLLRLHPPKELTWGQFITQRFEDPASPTKNNARGGPAPPRKPPAGFHGFDDDDVSNIFPRPPFGVAGDEDTTCDEVVLLSLSITALLLFVSS